MLKKRGPVPIKEVIPAVTQELSEGASQRGRIGALWEEVVGEKKSLYTKISSFEDGTLTIFISNASSLYELSLEKETILRKLQKRFKGIKDIRLKVT